MTSPFGASPFDPKPLSPTPLNRNSLAKTVAPEADNSALANFARFWSRPGFAVRSLMVGDVTGAVGNLAQMALDFPTGGFLDRRLSLNNLSDFLLPEALELPDDLGGPKAQREFTHVLDEWGVLRREDLGTWTKLGLDVVGGIVTDPLTFVTGGIGGISKGALTGTSRSALQSTVAQSLKKTSAGREALEAATREVAEEFVQKRGVMGFLPDDVTKLDRAFEARAAENLVRSRMTSAPRRLHEILDDNLLDEGLKALEAEKLIPTKGGLYWKFPGAEAKLLDPNFSSKITAFTGPAMGLRALDHFAPTSGEAVRELARGLYSSVRSSLFGRHLHNAQLPEINQGLQDAAHSHALRIAADDRKAHLRALELFGDGPGFKFEPHEMEVMGRAWDNAQEAFRKAASDDLSAEFKALKGDLLGWEKRAFQGPRAGAKFREWVDELPVSEATREYGRKLSRGIARGPDQPRAFSTFKDMVLKEHPLVRDVAGFRDDLEGHFWTKLLDDAKAGVDPAKHDALERALTGIRDDLTRIPAELRRKAGPWKLDSTLYSDLLQNTNPLYMPRQTSALYDVLLGESFGNEQLRTGLRDVFTKHRKHQDPAQFTEALKKLAAKHLDPETFGVVAENMQNFNLAQLYRQRMFAHNRTMARGELVATAKRMGYSEFKPSPLADYLHHQFKGMEPRKLTSVLGGGRIRLPVENNAALASWGKAYTDDLLEGEGKEAARLLKRRIVKRDGKSYVEIDFPGLNQVMKPLLTSFPTNLNFHVRNAYGAAFMGLFDPDVGMSGFKQLWGATRNSGLVAKFSKLGYTGDEITKVTRLLDSDPVQAKALLEELKATGKTVGKYSWDEVYDTLLKALGPETNRRVSSNATDLMTRLAEVDYLGRDVWRKSEDLKRLGAGRLRIMSEWFKRASSFGMDMSNSIERRFRANAVIELMGKGVAPDEAIKRMERAFVNYNVNSEAERFLRDVIPFFKFASHSGLWAKEFATGVTPGLRALRSGMGAARFSAQDEEGVLPERVSGSIALPLPWKDARGNQEFLLGLGLPIEATIQFISAATPTGFRQGILGGLNPPIRLAAEGLTNRSFYFGGEWASYRKAPAWLPRSMATEITLPNGKKTYEVSGEINEILNVLPTSRLDSTLHKLASSFVREEKPKITALLNWLTGVRTMSVDTQRELEQALKGYLHDRVRSGQIGETVHYFTRMDESKVPEDLKIVLSGLKSIQAEKRAARREAEKTRIFRGGAFQ